MVVQGKFQVEVVYADTKLPFKEFTSEDDGQLYLEVEPDAEYFIMISSKSEDPVIAEIKIDGTGLGSHVTGLAKHNSATPYLCGITSRDENGGVTKQALQFVKSTVLQKTEENKGIPPQYWTGTVEVSFYESTAEQVVTSSSNQGTRAFSSSWKGNSGDVGYMIGKSDPDKKKGVMSAAGNTTEYVPPPANQSVTGNGHKPAITTVYRKGGLLQTIHMKYCSTLGLIFANILPKPPCWDFQRMVAPGPQKDFSDKIDSSGAIDLSGGGDGA